MLAIQEPAEDTMPICLKRAVMALAFLLPASSLLAAEPAKHIGVYVQPYYEAARTPDAAPKVSVGATFSELLASTKREDILAARDKILADPKQVTPMTMMVLSIRLYDIGMRDDSVFWFYVAKDRFITLADVVDVQAGGLAQAAVAVKDFAVLAGPFVNGYAFCDITKQGELRRNALEWVEKNPYGAMFMDRLPAKSSDRNAALARSLADIKVSAEKERAYFADPKNVATFAAQRKTNQMDEKFCWKT
jgi:hypothetical protein